MSKGFQYNSGPLYDGGSPRSYSLPTHEFGVHLVEATQRFIYGTRFVKWDGSVYKYSLSGAACYTHMLNAFWNRIDSDVNGIDYSVLTNDQVIGDREITLTNGTTAVAEDYLAGGIVIIVPAEVVTNREVMTRGILGNDVAAAAAECTMYLDGPIEVAVTTSEYAYVMPSSYSNIRYSAGVNGVRSFAGLAAAPVTAAARMFWLQTYGPCNLAQQTTYVGKTAYYRMAYGKEDGTVSILSQTVESGGTVVSDQIVGFGLDNNAAANGTTNFMLTIST